MKLKFFAGIALGAAFLFMGLGVQAAKQSRPNFLIIDVCSARADHFSAYGYGRKTTPNVDSIAKKSALFENAVAQASWCLPNYATLFTGQRSENHGLYTNTPQGIPYFETTLAEQLQGVGYRTAAFSGGVYELPAWGLSRGFDSYVNLFSTAVPNRVPAPVADNLPAIASWIKKSESRGNKKPFFLYVSIDDLHSPYHADHPDMYDPGYQGIANDSDTWSVPFARAYNGEPGGYSPDLAQKARLFKKDPRNLRHLIARYDAALHTVDDRIARILAILRRRGLDKNTFVIITADHGEMLGEHGLLGHTQSLYEPVLHVPLIVSDPAESKGRRIQQLIERADIMPTILDRAGVTYQNLNLSGRSFLPLIDGFLAPWRRYAYASSKRNLSETHDHLIEERALRGENWKLIWYLYKNSFELYDLKNDPMETRDLSAVNPGMVSRMAFQLMNKIEESRPHQPGPPEAPSATGSLSIDIPKQ